MNKALELLTSFKARFGTGASVYRAPGRVNLIGEHTDYNLGLVLPIALDLACVAHVAAATDGGRLWVSSENRGEARDWELAELPRLTPSGDWTDYIVGVAQELIRAGYELGPLRISFDSAVPEGSGLSSSAALEVSCALALLNGRPIDRLKLAQLCQRAEREFVGVPSGVMDQYVSVFAQQGAALEIDCRSLTHRAVSLPPDVAIFAVNSMVRHDLAQSAYKQRTEQCAQAVAAIRLRYPQVRSLRDVDAALLAELFPSLPETPARRARHVVSENERVEKFVAASADRDLRRMGELFLASHRSLRSDYEVSCEELDFLVDAAGAIEGVYGARMTGGGFGGCTVNLVDPAAEAGFPGEIARRYQARFGIVPPVYRCRPWAGASEIR
jgi:galactokinase